jgi:hypothetical protein
MSTDPATHLYVYYRVIADTPVARMAVATLMDEIETATGVMGRLLRRCDDPGTWMEIYEPIDDAASFSQTLAALVARHGVEAIAVDGRRHTECFTALPPAAGSIDRPLPDKLL